MKLRNKKTGEIVEKYPDRFVINSGEQIRQYDTLAELNAEWEDYEEPNLVPDQIFMKGSRVCIDYKSVEAGRKAVEKLEAWKRLKDKGFRFELWDYDGGNYQEKISTGRILFRVSDDKEADKDLDLLFGGEE